MQLKSNKEITSSLSSLIKTCEANISELDMNIKNLISNKSFLLEATMINQNSFYLAEVNKDTIKNKLNFKIVPNS